MPTIDARLLDGNGEAEAAENFNRVLAISDAKQGFGTAVNAVAGTDNLTIATNPTADDTMTIGTKVYTFLAEALVDGDIAIGLDAAATQANIVAAINGLDSINDAHSLVSCGEFAVNVAAITAKVKGVAGIATTSTFTAGGNLFSEAALVGGADGTVGVKGAILVDADKIYVATNENTIHDANWKYVALT